MSFKKEQHDRVAGLIARSNIFNDDAGGGVFRGKSYPFVLNDSSNNLFPPVKSEVLTYFEKNKVAWWNGKMTGHTLSSQVACLNHLFPIREDRAAVLSIIKRFSSDIIDVFRIQTDIYKPAYIQFEAVSDKNHLNEIVSTRGMNCTSVDALLYGAHKDGRRVLFPIEWKYAEVYGDEKKSQGKRGMTRKERYTDLINKSVQLRTQNHDVFYFEPFYQLMRQTLWAEQMIRNNETETIEADDYMHIHVIPAGNRELLRTGNNRSYKCSGKGMESTWRSSIRDQNKYMIVSPKALLAPIDGKRYRPLLNYLETRYW